MNLQPDPNTPGLWKNTDWQPNTSGTFVILIGASAYDYLQGGKGNPLANPNYGLGQLAVSALTVYEIFRWFQNHYLYALSEDTECPLAQCWLLLSPTDDEINMMTPEIVQHALPSTFNNCKTAIRSWHHVMSSLPKTAAEQSRAFFMFSGHGLEIYQDEQIVLPCDYLQPVVGDLNDAVNIRKLAKALSALSVPDQFFFVDACRNDNKELREREIKGDGIITSELSYLTNPACNGPILYASAAGTQTYQPRSVNERFSLFGQALLDGLQAHEDFPLDCSQSPCAVKLAPLHEFLSLQYNRLLQRYGETLTQYILQAGHYSRPFATVTHIEQTTPAPTPLSSPSLPRVVDLVAQGFDNVLNFPGPLKSFHPNPHAVFGRESVTEMWENVRIYSFEKHSWISRPLWFHKVERTWQNDGYRVTISLPRGNNWIELYDDVLSFASVLPDDKSLGYNQNAPRYLIEFVMDDSRRIARLQASLSTDNDGNLGRVAQLWEKYQTVNAASAAEEIDLEELQVTVIDKLESPLAATVATLILLRAGRLDLLQEHWLINLMNLFPERPDSPIIYNEFRLAQLHGGSFPAHIAQGLLEMNRRGLPYTGEVLGYAARQVEDVLEFGGVMGEDRASLEHIQKRIAYALRFFRPSGLFTVFAADRGQLWPNLL